MTTLHHHKASDKESSTENCDVDCLNSGMCASSCVFGGAGLYPGSTFQLDRQNVMPFFEIPEQSIRDIVVLANYVQRGIAKRKNTALIRKHYAVVYSNGHLIKRENIDSEVLSGCYGSKGACRPNEMSNASGNFKRTQTRKSSPLLPYNIGCGSTPNFSIELNPMQPNS